MSSPEQTESAEKIAERLADDFAEHEMRTPYFASTRPYFEAIIAAAIQSERASADRRVEAAELALRTRIVEAALRLDSCMTEFDGDERSCGEYFDALWAACDAYREAHRKPTLAKAETP